MPHGALLNGISLASALHVPAGAAPSGLPVGAQLIGPIGADSRLLAIAQAIDENIRGFVAPGMWG